MRPLFRSRNAFQIRNVFSRVCWWVWNPRADVVIGVQLLIQSSKVLVFCMQLQALMCLGSFFFFPFFDTTMQKPWLFRTECLFSQCPNVLQKTCHRKRLTGQNLYVMLSASFNSDWRVYLHALSFLQPAPVCFKCRLHWTFVYNFPKVINSDCTWQSVAKRC